MAIIRSLEAGTSDVHPHRTHVDATYQFTDSVEHGELFHLATYGSDSRKSEPKVSQTIQMDKSTALAVADIIVKRFGSSY